MATDTRVGRFIIYGAGGIGGIVGGHLAMAGYDAVLVGRPDHMDAVRRNGLKLVKPEGTHTISVPAVTTCAEVGFQPDDVVLVTMKGQNTDQAMRDLHDAVEDVPVFCLQNGVRNEEIVSRHFPTTYGVRVNIGAVYMNPGEVVCRRDPPGWLIIGKYPTGSDALAETVGAALRQAAFYVLVTPDVMPYKWGKLMSNLANAIGAITNESFRSQRSITEATQREAEAILKEAGIRWLSQQEIEKEWPDFGAKAKAAINTDEQSSTWQSLGRQQGTVETDFLNGEIVRVAKRIGKTAPINEAINRITQEMAAKKERPGKYSAVELSRILGIS